MSRESAGNAPYAALASADIFCASAGVGGVVSDFPFASDLET